jgi:hypothetical protein
MLQYLAGFFNRTLWTRTGSMWLIHCQIRWQYHKPTTIKIKPIENSRAGRSVPPPHMWVASCGCDDRRPFNSFKRTFSPNSPIVVGIKPPITGDLWCSARQTPNVNGIGAIYNKTNIEDGTSWHDRFPNVIGGVCKIWLNIHRNLLFYDY